MKKDFLKQTVEYHETTKHDFGRFAPGPGYMDWANQPDPFRRFDNAPRIFLPVTIADDTAPFTDVMGSQELPCHSLSAESLSRFFDLSMAISAWKQAGDSRWALRCNPSSGNLHPIESYVVLPALENLHSQPGVFHYAPKDHALEQRAELTSEVWKYLMAHFPADSFLLGLSSIHWRESWKYGARAFRYCQHDVGHALAACRVAAGVLGWTLVMLEGMDDPSIAQVLGLDRKQDFENSEPECPDLLVVVFPAGFTGSIPVRIGKGLCRKIADSRWQGKAAPLSDRVRDWAQVETVAEACLKLESEPGFREVTRGGSSPEHSQLSDSGVRNRMTARQVIRQRRSAVAMDGVTAMANKDFFALLEYVLPRGVPWDTVSWSPRIHLCLFVHRVTGLAPGLYFLVRDPNKIALLQESMHKKFRWERPEAVPESLPLFLLEGGNLQSLATRVSCNQDIAGQGAFSLGMVSEFRSSLEEFGPWFYRRLFWESGMVGQMLYLGSEHLGLRSTGIGCYFDDPVHEILGLSGNGFQSLYHFTVGGPVEDPRLRTRESYPWACDLPAGRFPNRYGKSQDVQGSQINRVRSEKEILWNGRHLSRIGVQVQQGQGGQVGKENFNKVLQSSVNVFQVSPDDSGGDDELVLGSAINDKLRRNDFDPHDLFVISRVGLIQGNQGPVVDALQARNGAFDAMISLGEGKRFCLDPKYLQDQLERSLHRLGFAELDLFLVRLPSEPSRFWSLQEWRAHLVKAFQYLQMECDGHRLGGFGLSASVEFLDQLDMKSIQDEHPGLSGWVALEFHGNVVQDEAFVSQPGQDSLLARARRLGLKVIVDDFLTARFEGRSVSLVDFVEIENTEDSIASLKTRIREWEQGVLETPLQDGTLLTDRLRQIQRTSPFRLGEVASPFFSQELIPPDYSTRLHHHIQQIEFLGKQLVNANLWSAGRDEEVSQACRSLLQQAQLIYRAGMQARQTDATHGIRRQYFPDASPSRSLVSLIAEWLSQQGVDLAIATVEEEYVLSPVLACVQ